MVGIQYITICPTTFNWVDTKQNDYLQKLQISHAVQIFLNSRNIFGTLKLVPIFASPKKGKIPNSSVG